MFAYPDPLILWQPKIRISESENPAVVAVCKNCVNCACGSCSIVAVLQIIAKSTAICIQAVNGNSGLQLVSNSKYATLSRPTETVSISQDVSTVILSFSFKHQTVQ